MQQPTLQNVRVRSTRDALQIFYAVARRSLPLITRRLDAEERRAIVPGNVYVWEERSANSEATGLGMERWSVATLSPVALFKPNTSGRTAWAGALVESAMYGVSPQPPSYSIVTCTLHRNSCSTIKRSTTWAMIQVAPPPHGRK